jgi:DNA-binding transcriptional MerR regulator
MQIKYTIKDLERLSGIKAHTIRIWEQRYNLLSPERGGRNVRSYSNQELKKLLNVNYLNQCGYKISEIASLTEEELREKLTSVTTDVLKDNFEIINILILAMIDIDEDKFNTTLNKFIESTSFENCMDNVIFPFMRKIGIMWQAGAVNPAQEHFTTNLIRQKVICQIDALPYGDRKSAETYILYLPQGEWHELSLLYYSFLIKKLGVKYLYLGQSVPLYDLGTIINSINPTVVITIITSPTLELGVQEYLNSLSALLPKGIVFVSGFQMFKNKFELPANIKIFNNTEHFFSLLKDND